MEGGTLERQTREYRGAERRGAAGAQGRGAAGAERGRVWGVSPSPLEVGSGEGAAPSPIFLKIFLAENSVFWRLF